MDFQTRLSQLYDDLINLGYPAGSIKKEDFCNAFCNSQPNMLFVNISAWLSVQLVEFSSVESKISPFEEGDDFLGFMVEISSLLKELNCPIKKISSGPLDSRLSNSQDQTDALVFLCSELQAAKLIFLKKPKESTPMKIELEESRTAKELKEMLIALSFGKPPDSITTQMLFGEVDKKVKLLSQPLPPKNFVEERLFSGYLTEKQWFQIDDMYRELFQEYQTRRQLLITRLEVTVESFLWSDRLKNKVEEIRNMFNKQKPQLSLKPLVKISDILAASSDLLTIEKTSCAAVRKNTKCTINKVIIGSVPDRGGRPEEQQPPPPEIPSWQKNDSSSRGGFNKSADNRSRQGDNSYQQDRQRQYQAPRDDRQRKDQHYSHDNSRQQFRNRDPYNMNDMARQPPINANRMDYNPVFTPVQQVNPYTSQFGFGGYGPAGDNFSQFGGYGQSAPVGGDGHGHRGGGGRGGGGNYRGSRPYRGNPRGGRNRY
ncbi:protein FAM98A [Parasteatoda tepidariorum]|uniref:protein FAM98A n=1 Tax=Parasteatoda tepidariorum TaxID=114398 RepID=UPI00077F9993|nr:protein FAM98A [Parasteatoda tepidariorum]